MAVYDLISVLNQVCSTDNRFIQHSALNIQDSTSPPRFVIIKHPVGTVFVGNHTEIGSPKGVLHGHRNGAARTQLAKELVRLGTRLAVDGKAYVGAFYVRV